ncbi:hypothetical protein E1163_05150 [Fulvivirga kasyanovii]|uniref:Uncharacterized protein n=1 Tax=Fulvivirga kasyanovii TaxID=396812 RepID=A0ABW9RKW8_9BACT|nr:hypothetical protein [Fulvivirga kasyanovii]MTI24326.1 hypothetical protein [Fulvivirga kasyanovii]
MKQHLTKISVALFFTITIAGSSMAQSPQPATAKDQALRVLKPGATSAIAYKTRVRFSIRTIWKNTRQKYINKYSYSGECQKVRPS